MIPILVILLLMDGKPMGDSLQIPALDHGCKYELETVRNMNRVLENKGIEILATCEDLI